MMSRGPSPLPPNQTQSWDMAGPVAMGDESAFPVALRGASLRVTTPVSLSAA